MEAQHERVTAACARLKPSSSALRNGISSHRVASPAAFPALDAFATQTLAALGGGDGADRIFVGSIDGDLLVDGGIVRNIPRYATIFMIFMLASVGLPGTSGFVGEFLALLGAFQANTAVAAFAATGVILGAAYMLYLYRRVVFGPVTNNEAAAMPDVDYREMMIFIPIIALVIWLGVQPGYVLERTEPAVKQIISNYNAALVNASGPAEITSPVIEEDF